jgi:polysaccharide export outer membrane protein
MLAGVAPALRAQAPVPGEGGLQPGDVVQITVWQRDELSGEFTVTPDGSLSHPLYRQVRVTGIPASQVEERVRSFLSAYEANPQIVVQPMYKVAVAGAVMQPNIYNVPPGTTVGQVVIRAGGVVEGGNRDDVRLVRAGRETRLNLAEAQALQMALQSGDQVLITAETPGRGFVQTVLPILHAAMTVTNLVLITQRD